MYVVLELLYMFDLPFRESSDEPHRLMVTHLRILIINETEYRGCLSKILEHGIMH